MQGSSMLPAAVPDPASGSDEKLADSTQPGTDGAPRAVERVKSVSVLALRPMINGFEKLGVERSIALRAADLSTDKLSDPDARVSPTQIWLLWQKALEITGDPCLGLHLAETVSPSDYGIVGYIAVSSATIRDALIRLNRYHGLLADAVHYSFEEMQDGFFLRHGFSDGKGVPGAMAAYVLAVPLLVIRQAFGREAKVQEVRLTCERPAETQEYERFFNAPLLFGTDENALRVAIGLDSSVPTADAALISLLEGYAESLVENLSRTDSLASTVQMMVMDGLHDGAPTALGLGRKLGLSSRTLRRRLQEEGTTFSAIISDTRHRLALEYLASDDLGASEIAYLIGFADPTAFHRAFKRWQGCTPLEHRRKIRAQRA